MPATSTDAARAQDASGGGAPPLLALAPYALAATRAAAIACQVWVGHGEKEEADGAATEAMRAVLDDAPGAGTVVIGEGEKDEAPMLHNDERVGTGADPAFDIAVDPLECTSFCAAGLPGALATIAFAQADTFWAPGPAHYMDKLVVGPKAREVIDIRDSPEENLERIAEALEKDVKELRVVVLDKPRHEDLIARLRKAGAAVSTPADGDVAGALDAVLPHGDADVLMGIGGTPEGVMTAGVVRALGGGMQGRVAPQSDEEAEAVSAAGLEPDHVLELEELAGGECIFAATGVTGGTFLSRPWRVDDEWGTESVLIVPGTVQRIVEEGAR